MQRFGSRLAKARKNKGYSQKEFAERLGVSQGRLSNWENGANLPFVDMFARIVKELEVDADWLLGNKK